MTTSQTTPFLSDVLAGERIPEEKLAYFRARLRNRFHSFMLAQFARADISKAVLARKVGKEPAQISRWLGAPANWELDTISDLLLGMGYEPNLSAANLNLGAIQPTNEHWRKEESELPARPSTQAANDDTASRFGGVARNEPERRFG